jgi:hypothetical protein
MELNEMILPEWTPELVKPVLQEIDCQQLLPGRRAVFERLVNDPRMRHVYTEWLKRDRETGSFHRPARHSSSESSSAAAQVSAIREVLRLTISAASDQISVTKPGQIEEAKLRWLGHAKLLRDLAHDLELAAEHGQFGMNDPLSREIGSHDIEAVRRIANWLEHLTTATRHPDDPLMVDRDSGDPVARGVQIMIGIKMEEQFGERLDGTAATLTSIALATKTTPRVSRSALTRKKAPKKRTTA